MRHWQRNESLFPGHGRHINSAPGYSSLGSDTDDEITPLYDFMSGIHASTVIYRAQESVIVLLQLTPNCLFDMSTTQRNTPSNNQSVQVQPWNGVGHDGLTMGASVPMWWWRMRQVILSGVIVGTLWICVYTNQRARI
jgi:hypothetical protein